VAQIFWDASSLVKRYYKEQGSETVDALFAAQPSLPMLTTFLGYAETHSILIRKCNRRDLSARDYKTASSALEREVVSNPTFGLLDTPYDAMLEGIDLIKKHNINASDAAILVVFLRYAKFLAASGSTCVLVAADQRLLRAAQAEGLHPLNPQTLSPTDVPAFLAKIG